MPTLDPTRLTHGQLFRHPPSLGNEVPEYFACPITLDVFRDPVVAADGRTYERALIEEAFATHGLLSPISREALAHAYLAPNWTLRSEMQDCGYALDAPASTKPSARCDTFEIAPPCRPVRVLGALRSPRANDKLSEMPPSTGMQPWDLFTEEAERVWGALGDDETAAMQALDGILQAGEVGCETAMLYIAENAVCLSVRLEAVSRLGDVPSVAAVDMLRGLTNNANSAIAKIATFKLGVGSAQMLDLDASDAPREIQRCLRDLICHTQTREDVCRGVLFVLVSRGDADPADVAEHLAYIAARCHAQVAAKAWACFTDLCGRHVAARATGQDCTAMLLQAAARDGSTSHPP